MNKKLEQVDLILCGEAAIDTYAGQVGPMLAEQLGIQVITYTIKVNAESDKITAERDVGDSLMTVEAGYPVLLTAKKELNEPRLPNMMQILQAANKKKETWSASDLGLEAEQIKNRLTTGAVKGFKMNRKNIMIDGEPEEVVSKLIEHLNSALGR